MANAKNTSTTKRPRQSQTIRLPLIKVEEGSPSITPLITNVQLGKEFDYIDIEAVPVVAGGGDIDEKTYELSLAIWPKKGNEMSFNFEELLSPPDARFNHRRTVVVTMPLDNIFREPEDLIQAMIAQTGKLTIGKEPDGTLFAHLNVPLLKYDAEVALTGVPRSLIY